jgi:DNA helicase HerA-like ATPase
MKGINPDVQQIIVAKLLSNLFEARKAGLVPPGMVVVEEAHNFCPEKGFMKTTSSDVLRAIASEGRKFGLGLMIISQRPAKVDKNVLSQCNTQIIMRVTNPNDIRAITKSLEGISSELEEEIKRLPPGIALFVNPDIPRAVMVQVRVRKSKHGGASKEISGDIEPEEAEDEAPAPAESGVPGESLFRKLFGKR